MLLCPMLSLGRKTTWAGKTSTSMTQEALESCARGTMWTDYEPTPLTREWLKERTDTLINKS